MKSNGRADRVKIGHGIRTVEQRMPFGGVLRSMAAKVLHDKVTPPLDKRAIGEKHSAKRRFGAEQVIEMRRRWNAGERICNLAREFQMQPHSMGALLNGITYAWVR